MLTYMRQAFLFVISTTIEVDTLAANLFQLCGGSRYLQEESYFLMLLLAYIIRPKKTIILFREWTRLLLQEMDTVPLFMRETLHFLPVCSTTNIRDAKVEEMWFLLHKSKDVWFSFRNRALNVSQGENAIEAIYNVLAIIQKEKARLLRGLINDMLRDRMTERSMLDRQNMLRDRMSMTEAITDSLKSDRPLSLIRTPYEPRRLSERTMEYGFPPHHFSKDYTEERDIYRMVDREYEQIPTYRTHMKPNNAVRPKARASFEIKSSCELVRSYECPSSNTCAGPVYSGSMASYNLSDLENKTLDRMALPSCPPEDEITVTEKGALAMIKHKHGDLAVLDADIQLEFDTVDNFQAYCESKTPSSKFKLELTLGPNVRPQWEPKFKEKEESEADSSSDEDSEEEEEDEDSEEEIELEKKFTVTEQGTFTTLTREGYIEENDVTLEFEFDTEDNRSNFYLEHEFLEPTFCFVPNKELENKKVKEVERFHLVHPFWDATPIEQKMSRATRTTDHFRPNDSTEEREVSVTLTKEGGAFIDLNPVDRQLPTTDVDCFTREKQKCMGSLPKEGVIRNNAMGKRGSYSQNESEAKSVPFSQILKHHCLSFEKPTLRRYGITSQIKFKDPHSFHQRTEPQPELAQAEPVRVATTPEPDEGEELHSDTIRLFTGRDPTRQERHMLFIAQQRARGYTMPEPAEIKAHFAEAKQKAVESSTLCYTDGFPDMRKTLAKTADQLQAKGEISMEPTKVMASLEAEVKRDVFERYRHIGTGKLAAPSSLRDLAEYLEPRQDGKEMSAVAPLSPAAMERLFRYGRGSTTFGIRFAHEFLEANPGKKIIVTTATDSSSLTRKVQDSIIGHICEKDPDPEFD